METIIITIIVVIPIIFIDTVIYVVDVHSSYYAPAQGSETCILSHNPSQLYKAGTL